MADPVSNGLYGVPWGIGGGQAILQAEVARLFAYLSLGGLEGVLGKDHLTPSQLATPGAGIQLAPGGLAVLNRSPGINQQSYLDLASSTVLVDLDPTTSVARTDLVMVRVEDPYVSGNPWSPPTDLQDGPYIVPRVEYGVPSGLKTVVELGHAWSAIPICKVTRPSATATILNSHIVDLRVLINSLTGGIQPAPNAYAEKSELTDIKAGPLSPASVLPSNTSYIDWPPEANWTIPIPSWATYLELDIDIKGALVVDGSFWADIRPVIGGVSQAPKSIDVNKPDVGATTHSVWVGGEYYIQPILRGTNTQIKIQCKSNGEPGKIQTYDKTYTRAFFKFKQTPGVA